MQAGRAGSKQRPLPRAICSLHCQGHLDVWQTPITTLTLSISPPYQFLFMDLLPLVQGDMAEPVRPVRLPPNLILYPQVAAR